MSIQNLFLPIFHIFFIIVLSCFGTSSNFCATCNCCLPAVAPTDQIQGVAEPSLAGNEFLSRQNDALVPPNPKPLIPDKFYKIEFKQSADKENQQLGVPKLALGSLLQMPTKPVLGEALPSQAILFPVPVATLIFQHPIAPKCNCDASTTTTTTNAPTTTEDSTKCVKCREEKSGEGEHDEGQQMEEKVAEGCAGVDAENGGKLLDDAECQSKEQEKEGSSHEEVAPEHSEIDEKEGGGEDCQGCGEDGCCHEKEEENIHSTSTGTTASTTMTTEAPLEDQKIPLEIFKKFVAKNLGFAPPKVPPPNDGGVKPRDESFENLKDRLKEISNKMDLLKNLSLEMKYPHQQQQRLFPMARFGDLNRNRLMLGGGGWQSFGPKMDQTVPMEGRGTYGAAGTFYGPPSPSNQQQQQAQPPPPPLSPSFSPPQHQQQQFQFQRQVPLQQNGMHQFGAMFSSDLPSRKLEEPGNGTHGTVEEKPPISRPTALFTTITTTQMTTASTKLNHQQFLLNAIEEFLRESQKIRQMTIGNTILGKLKEEEAIGNVGNGTETEAPNRNETQPVESTEEKTVQKAILMGEAPKNDSAAVPSPLTTTTAATITTYGSSTNKMESATMPATTPCPPPTEAASTPTDAATTSTVIPATTSSPAIEVANNSLAIEEANANNQTTQILIAAQEQQQNGTDTQQQEQPTPGPFNAQEWMVSSSTVAAPENVPQMTQFPPQQMPPVNQQIEQPEKAAGQTQMNMAVGEAIPISNSTASNQTGQPTIGQVQNDQAELRPFEDEEKNGSNQTGDLESAQQQQAEIAVDEDAPSESVWQQQPKNGTHARLINLITSLSGGPQNEDSEENANASQVGQQNGQREGESNESGPELPKFLSTRHIKGDEAEGEDAEDITSSSSTMEVASSFCFFHRLFLTFCTFAFVLFH